MADAATDVKVTSPHLFQLFKDCYRTFDRKFDEEAGKNAIICFGITGAGKSTLLARLLSDLPPREFVKALKYVVPCPSTPRGVTVPPSTLSASLLNSAAPRQAFSGKLITPAIFYLPQVAAVPRAVLVRPQPSATPSLCAA
jgi:hypothetical protein